MQVANENKRQRYSDIVGEALLRNPNKPVDMNRLGKALFGRHYRANVKYFEAAIYNAISEFKNYFYIGKMSKDCNGFKEFKDYIIVSLGDGRYKLTNDEWDKLTEMKRMARHTIVSATKTNIIAGTVDRNSLPEDGKIFFNAVSSPIKQLVPICRTIDKSIKRNAITDGSNKE
jgi:hypothetical protein